MPKTMRRHVALIALTALVLCPTLALAQARSDQTESRLLRLENEIQTLSRAIYRGERPVQPLSFSQSSNGSGDFAILSQRLTSMENELRRLIGKIEEQGHKIRMLENQLGAASTAAPSGNLTTGSDINLDIPPQMNPSQPDIVNTPQPEAQPNQLGTLRTTEDGAVQSATINGVDMTASRLYDQAFAQLQNGNYAEAESSFFTFLNNYSGSPLAANAQYWLAETQFIQSDFDGAARNFALGYQEYPNSPKAPDNLLKLGLSLSKLDQRQEACVTLQELLNTYPQAPRSVLDKAIAEQTALSCG